MACLQDEANCLHVPMFNLLYICASVHVALHSEVPLWLLARLKGGKLGEREGGGKGGRGRGGGGKLYMTSDPADGTQPVHRLLCKQSSCIGIALMYARRSFATGHNDEENLQDIELSASRNMHVSGWYTWAG